MSTEQDNQDYDIYDLMDAYLVVDQEGDLSPSGSGAIYSDLDEEDDYDGRDSYYPYSRGWDSDEECY